MTFRDIIDRLRPYYYLGEDWYRPRYRKGWLTGFHEGIDYGRRLWGVHDDLMAALFLLSDEDRHFCPTRGRDGYASRRRATPRSALRGTVSDRPTPLMRCGLLR